LILPCGHFFISVAFLLCGGWASAVCCFCSHGAISFLICQSAGASCLFDKHPHLNQSRCKARLCQKKYCPVAQRSEWRFFLSKPVGLGLDVKGIVEKFATKKMGGIIDQGLETLIRKYEVAGSMGGGGTKLLMPYAVKLPNAGTE